MKAVEVDRCENVGSGRLDDVKARVRFNLSPCQGGVNAKFPRGVHKILLKHLKRNHARSPVPVFHDQMKCSCLLLRIGEVVAVKQDVAVEESPG